jgi:phosphoribosylanthranilate isomerase
MAAALDADADMVGLVMFPPSPRSIDVGKAARLADQARGRAKIVVLLVDPDDALVDRIAAEVRPDVLQLHGNETPARVSAIRARVGKPVMKAIKVRTRDDAIGARAYRSAADLILFDAAPPKDADRPGGHGRTFDWALLDGVKDDLDWVLSGGLTAANVAEAVRATRASAVDVSSGVETAPGVKDAELIRAFVAAARAA